MRTLYPSLSLLLALVFGCGGEATQGQLPLSGAGAGGASGGHAGAAGGAGQSNAGVGETQAGSSGGGTAGAAGSGPGTAGTAGTGASGGTGGTGDTDASVDPAPTPGLFPPVTDFEASGPYTSTTLQNVGPSNGYTVYLPSQLAPGGAKNPIVGWMSGGSTTHTGYTLLPHLATHGFVIVAANTVPGIGQEVALGAQILAGLDWAIAENDRVGSELYGKLDTTHIASMGYSMGSLATFTIATDPRLTTTVHISGGNMVPERVNNLHAPAAFICGTPGDVSCNLLSADCDIAAVNCDTDFANAQAPVFYANFTGGHLGILTPPLATRITGMTTAWLRYQLMGDTTLASKFIGGNCDYCKDATWKVQQKQL